MRATLLAVAAFGLVALAPAGAAAEPPATAPIEGFVNNPDISSGKRADVCRADGPGTTALKNLLTDRFKPRQVQTQNCREKNNKTCKGRQNPPSSKCWSNHANGRALDIIVSRGKAQGAEKAKGDAVVAFLLATDSAGNLNARARRLGVQEIIWFERCWNNRRMEDRGVKTAAQMRYCGVPNHLDHPHLSLNFDGREKRTSWWRPGKTAGPSAPKGPSAPAPTPDAPAPTPADDGGVVGPVEPLLERNAPTITAWDANRLDVFQTLPDGTTRQKYNDDGTGWSPWVPQGGRNDSSPDAGAAGPNRLDVFARGTRDGAPASSLMQRFFDGTRFSDWVAIAGGTLGSAPSVVARRDQDRYDVFYRGPDGALTQRYRTSAGWTAPLTIGPRITSAPDAAFQGGSRYDVFYRTADGRLGQSYFNGTQWVHVVIGGAIASAPAAVSSQPGSLDVFAIDGAGDLVQHYFRPGQGAWITQKRLDAAGAGADVTSRGPGRLELVTLDAQGRVVFNAFNDRWIGWGPI